MSLVSDVQQSNSVIRIHVAILFQIFCPFGLLQNIEQHSLCYTVGPCWLSILNIVVCTSEKAMVTHSSTLAWKIAWMEEPGRLQFMQSLRVGHN